MDWRIGEPGLNWTVHGASRLIVRPTADEEEVITRLQEIANDLRLTATVTQ
jgi:hypothetical protein